MFSTQFRKGVRSAVVAAFCVMQAQSWGGPYECVIAPVRAKMEAGSPLLVKLKLLNRSAEDIELKMLPEARYGTAFLLLRSPGAAGMARIATEPSATAHFDGTHLTPGQAYVTYALLCATDAGLLFQTPGSYRLRGVMMPHFGQEITSPDAHIAVVSRPPEEMARLKHVASDLARFSVYEVLPPGLLEQYEARLRGVEGFAEFLLLAEALAGSNVYNARPPERVEQALESLSETTSPVWQELAWLFLARHHAERFHLADAGQALEKLGNARSRVADHVRETLSRLSPGQVAAERERVLKPLLNTLSLPRNQLEDKDAAELWRLADSLAQWEAKESADRLIVLCDLRAVCPRPGLEAATTPHLQYPFASALVAIWRDDVQKLIRAQLGSPGIRAHQQRVLVWCLQRSLGRTHAKQLLEKAAGEAHSDEAQAQIKRASRLIDQGALLLSSPAE